MNCKCCNEFLSPEFAQRVLRGKASPVCNVCSGGCARGIAGKPIRGRMAYIAVWEDTEERGRQYYVAIVKAGVRGYQKPTKLEPFGRYRDADEKAWELNKELGITPRQAMGIAIDSLRRSKE